MIRQAILAQIPAISPTPSPARHQGKNAAVTKPNKSGPYLSPAPLTHNYSTALSPITGAKGYHFYSVLGNIVQHSRDIPDAYFWSLHGNKDLQEQISAHDALADFISKVGFRLLDIQPLQTSG